MSLELQVNVGNAKSDIDDVSVAITRLAGIVNGFDTGPIDKLSTAFAAVKPVDPAIADSVAKVGTTAKEAAPDVDKLKDSLDKLSTAKASDAAADIQKIGESARSAAQAAPELGRLGEGLRGVGPAASSAGSGMGALNSAMDTVLGHTGSVGSAFEGLTTHFGAMPGLTGAASSGISAFAEAAGGVPGILIGIASAIAAINWHAIAEGAMEANQHVEQLQRSINVFSKNAQAAPQALEMLEHTATKLGYSLEGLEKSFGKYTAIAAASGKSTETINKNFEAMATATQASGAGLEKLPILLNTVDRWMSTGTMTAGMLGRSLAQVNLTLDVLGPGFKGLARDTQLPITAMQKMIDAMGQMKPAVLTLAENAQVLANSWHQLSVAFGEGMKVAAVASFQDLNHVVEAFLPQLKAVAQVAGQVYGFFMNLANMIESVLVVAFGTLIQIVQGAWNVLNDLSFGALNGLVGAVGSAITAIADFVGWIGPKLQEALSQAITFTRGVALFLTNELTAAFKSAGAAALDFMKTLGSMALNALVSVWQALPDWLTGTLAGAWNEMKSIAVDVIAGIKSAWASLTDRLKAGWQEWIDYYKNNQPQATTPNPPPDKTDFKPNNTPTRWPDLGQPQAGRPTTNPLGYDPKTGLFSGAGNGGGGYYRPPVSGIASNTMDWGFGMGVNHASNRGRDLSGGRTLEPAANPMTGLTNGVIRGGQVGPQDQFNNPEPASVPQALNTPVSVPALNIPQPTVEDLTKAIEKANADETTRLANEQESWSKLTQGDQAAGLDNAPGVFSPALAALEATAAMNALANNPQLQDQLAGLNNTNNNLQPGETIAPTGGLTTDAANDLGRALSELGTSLDDVRSATADAARETTGEMRTLGGELQGLDGAVQQLDTQGMADLATAMQAVGETFQNIGDGLGSAMDAVAGSLDNLNDTCQTLDSSVQLQTLSNWENTFAEEQNTISQDANTNATQADTAANYADAAAQSGGDNNSGDSSGNGGGGGGQTPDNSYFDVGGVVGSWGGRAGPGLPASAWDGARHFADGGLTDGGIPIVAHPNEAVVPLKGGAIPVAIGTGIAQGLAMVRETIINVGTLAHNDALAMMGVLNLINVQELALLGAFNNAWSAVQSQRSSGGSGGVSRASSGGGNSGTLDPAYLAPALIRGMWGTSNQGGYLPASATNVMTLPGGHKTDFLGRPIVMGGAADGLENTNSLPGMSESGVPLTVHPNEAVVNLNGGGAIPVELRGGAQRSGANNTFNIRMTVNAKDAASFGRGPTQDQIRQQLQAELSRAAARIGTLSLIDDPTVRN